MTKRLLSFGHGYSARALASLLLPQGWEIYGTYRNELKREQIEKTGVTPVKWGSPEVLSILQKCNAVLSSVAPVDGKDPVLEHYGSDINAADLEWVGYLSTTGVYGDHKGGWVDEETPLTPSTKRGQARVAAEEEWSNLNNIPLHIFRLAGIYGPGRGPFAKVRNGTARRIIKEGQVFSRIHVDDIAQVVAASLNAPKAGSIYNLCDDDPAPPEDVIAFAAELLDLPIPEAVPFETADMTPMARSFYAESKRVDNSKIKNELGIRLKYPDYKSGLTAMLASASAAK